MRPELTPNWRDLGNPPNVDEYVRRQGMTAQEYAEWLGRLKARLSVGVIFDRALRRPSAEFAHLIIDPKVSDAERARQLKAHDPRYFTSYYAIDCGQLQAAGSVIGAADFGGALSAAACAGGGRRSARSVLRRARRRFCNAATARFTAAPAARRRAASTAC